MNESDVSVRTVLPDALEIGVTDDPTDTLVVLRISKSNEQLRARLTVRGNLSATRYYGAPKEWVRPVRHAKLTISAPELPLEALNHLREQNNMQPLPEPKPVDLVEVAFRVFDSPAEAAAYKGTRYVYKADKALGLTIGDRVSVTGISNSIGAPTVVGLNAQPPQYFIESITDKLNV